jgi:putative DNA primase/helicase
MSFDAGDWFDKVANSPIPMIQRGDRPIPAVPSAKFKIGKIELSVGAGGIHSVDSPGVHYPTKRSRLVAVDVSSFYPSLIASKGLGPATYGDAGRQTYRSILERRLQIKEAARKETDPVERKRLEVQADGLKLIVNSFFGKTGDRFSSLYDPGVFLAVTLSGQLMLIDLIERLTEAKVRVISANTDGLFLRVPRSNKRWREVLRQWESDTEMRLDVEPLKRLVILASNQYATLNAKGKVKRKGADLRGDLDCSHAPNFLVIRDAVAAALLFDIPPEKTVFSCSDPVRFCSVTKRSSKAKSMVTIDHETESELPRVARWYRSKGSQRRIEVRFDGGRHTTPACALGVAISQDLPESLPDDIDWSFYLGQARRKIQATPGYRHLATKRLQGNGPAELVRQKGLVPVPKYGKAQPAGSNVKHPTLLWDWPSYPTLGTYTGPDLGLMVVDVDQAEKFRKFVDAGNQPLLYDRWTSLAGSLVSFHGTATADGVRTGKDRGKLIFKFDGGPDHPLCTARKKWLKSRGIEVLFGNEIPSILGQYGDDGDVYQLAGDLGPAPEWLIKAITPRKRVQKVKAPAISPEAKQEALEGLPAMLAQIDPRLGDPAIGWRLKEVIDGREIWIGRCPFTHDSGRSEDADLSAGVHDDGPYLHCQHGSCEESREISLRLRERHEKDHPAAPAGPGTVAPSSSGNPPPMTDWPTDPKPVRHELPPVPPLTPEMIPSPLRGWLTDIAERVGCALEFPVVGGVTALGIVVGRKIGIHPKRRDDWTVVPNLWGGIVGRPGVLKSPALKEAVRPLRRLEKVAEQAHKLALKQFNIDWDVAQAQSKAAKKELDRAALDKRGVRTQLEALAANASSIQIPDEPTLRRYTTSDATAEKLGELLASNPNGIGIVRDELTGWLRRLEEPEQGTARSFFLEAYEGLGDNFQYDRIGRGHILIPHCTVSVLGGIQPGPLRAFLRLVAEYGKADDGLISRFSVSVWPDQGGWKNVDRWPDTAAKNKAIIVFDRLDSGDPVQLGAMPDPEGGPPTFRFAYPAQDLFDSWRETLENTKLRTPDENPLVESHLAKYRKLMPALALLFHLAETADGRGSGPVSLQAAELAVKWCDLLEAHARRIYACVTDGDVEPARALANKIKAGALPSPFAYCDVYHRGWSGLDDAKSARSAVALLEERGWVRVVRTQQTGGGPREDIYIHPKLPRKPP